MTGINIYGFMATIVRLITTEIGRMIAQHAMAITCR